jgi:hypothetical protein
MKSSVAATAGALMASWIVGVLPAAHADTTCSGGGKPERIASPDFSQEV